MEIGTPITVTIRQGDPEIDAIGIFRGFTAGDDWNGWATPFFTRAEGERIVAWTEAMAQAYPPDSVETVRWNQELNAFVIENPDDPHLPDEPVPDEDVISPVQAAHAEEPLYGIGAYRWTWEALPDQPAG